MLKCVQREREEEEQGWLRKWLSETAYIRVKWVKTFWTHSIYLTKVMSDRPMNARTGKIPNETGGLPFPLAALGNWEFKRNLCILYAVNNDHK